MPNWCQNTLLIKGDQEEVARLLEHVKGPDTELSLNKIITIPEELKSASSPERNEDVAAERIKKYGASDWYSFSVSNWGTKWDVEAQITHDDGLFPLGYNKYNVPEKRFVQFTFDSAWSPPIPAIQMLAKQFPKVNIYHSWDETGCDFSGYSMYSGGELVEQQEWDSLENMRQYIQPDEDIFERFPTKEEGETNEAGTLSLADNV